MRKMVISYEAIETYSIPDDIDDKGIRDMRRFCTDRIDQVEAFLEKKMKFFR